MDLEFGSEQPLHLPIVIVASFEERDELLGYLSPIHVEGEYTEVLAAYVSRLALQLSRVIVPIHAVALNEWLD